MVAWSYIYKQIREVVYQKAPGKEILIRQDLLDNQDIRKIF